MYITILVFILISVIIFYFIMLKYYNTERYELREIDNDKTTHIRGNYIDIFYENETIHISKESDNNWYMYKPGIRDKIALQYNIPFEIENELFLISKKDKIGGFFVLAYLAIITTILSLLYSGYDIIKENESDSLQIQYNSDVESKTTDSNITKDESKNPDNTIVDNVEKEDVLPDISKDNDKYIDWNSYQTEDYMRRSLINNPSEMGISVSKYQQTIDWQKVKEDGIDFTIIQVGSRGRKGGDLRLDPYFEENMDGAIANNIKTGVCIYSQAITLNEVDEEIDLIINSVKKYTIVYPIGFSLERNEAYRTSELSNEEYIDIIKYYYNRIEQEGYTPMIMGDLDWFQKFPEETFYGYLKLVYNDDFAPNDIDNCIIWQFEHEAEEAVDGLGEDIQVSMNLSAYISENEIVN